MGSSTGPQATSFASRVPGAGPRGVIKTFRLLICSDVAWGRVGKEGEGRIQPCSPHQAGWLQTQSLTGDVGRRCHGKYLLREISASLALLWKGL